MPHHVPINWGLFFLVNIIGGAYMYGVSAWLERRRVSKWLWFAGNVLAFGAFDMLLRHFCPDSRVYGVSFMGCIFGMSLGRSNNLRKPP